MLFAVAVGGCAVHVDYYAEEWVVECSEVAEVIASGPTVLVDFGFHLSLAVCWGLGLKVFRQSLRHRHTSGLSSLFGEKNFT